MASREERQQIHELRKAERPSAFGGTQRTQSTVTRVRAREGSEGLGTLTKAEQDLLRSKALTVEDNPWQRIQFTSKFSTIAPTYDPTVLSIVSFQNNTLRQCIAAMMSNIDGTGYDIKRKDGGVIAQIVSPDSPEPLPPPPEPEQPTPTPNPTGLQVKPGSAGMAPMPPPTLPPKEVPVPGQPFPAEEGAQPIMIDPPDVARLAAFWNEPYPGISFMTMRSNLRENLETTGNAYLEIIRDASGKIALLNPMDSKLTRMIRHDDQPVAVTHTINRTGIPGEDQKVTILQYERRYVQIIGMAARFFKAYKATRDLNSKTGMWVEPGTTPAQMPAEDLATEVLHFWVDKDVLTPYGIPRWINQMPSVMGSRKAEELNLEFFEHGGVPPVMIMIQGGSLGAASRRDLTEYLAGKAKYKQRGVIMEISPASGDLNSAGQVKTDVHTFGDANDKDSKFEAYDAKCTQRVRSSFRLPAVLIGLEESYNYATVQTAVMMAEEQVFNPERVKFDELINATIMKELDPDGVYVFESKRMTAKFLDEQIKALTLAKGTVQGQGFVDAINEVAGLDLKFDQVAADNAQKMQQAQLAGAAAPGGGANAGTGDSGESTSGGGAGANASPQGGSNTNFAGMPGKAKLAKSSTALGDSSTAIDQNDVSNPQMTVPAQMTMQLTKRGKIEKLDEHLLTDLTNDMAAWMNGDKTFLQSNVEAMTNLVKSMTPAYQKLFAENVANKILKANHDPAGVTELLGCTQEVLARLSIKKEGGAADLASKKDSSVKNRSLYVQRAVTNADTIIAWAKENGFTTCLPPESMHVTVCYSKVPFDTTGLKPDKNAITCKAGDRQLSEFGPEQDTVVLQFSCDELEQDHQMYVDAGASWDWPEYNPHISLTLQKPPKLDLDKITPYSGPIELGPETFGDCKKGANEALVEKDDPRILAGSPAYRYIAKFSEDQARDTDGKWTAQGNAAASPTGTGKLQDGSGVSGGPSGVDALGRPNFSAGETPLEGLPTDVSIPGQGKIAIGPYHEARQAARDYTAKAGLPYHPPTKYIEVDPKTATAIANEYESMHNDPDDPQVKASYAALIKEMLAQYQVMKATGLKVDAIDFTKMKNPWEGSLRLVAQDVINNHHMWYFPTSAGFGSDADFDASHNPLLQDSGERDGQGNVMLNNDVFRVVHDYFGHIKEGVGFDASGEDNAWRSHREMFSELARGAMTSETRGQSSWVNWGPYGEHNQTAPLMDVHYAQQKSGIMPSWTWDTEVKKEERDAHGRWLSGEPHPLANDADAGKARLKVLDAQAKQLHDASPEGLTAKNALKFQTTMLEGDSLRYDRAKPVTQDKVTASPDERLSTLSPSTNTTIVNDARRSKPIYMAMRAGVIGTFDNADTPVDDILKGKNPSISASQFYNNFAPTRQALKADFGDHITLYRSPGQQRQKPFTNWATTEKYAAQYGGGVISKQVPITHVLAGYANANGKYHELLVGEPPITKGDVNRDAKGEFASIPDKPGTVPIPEGHVRLYHQTGEDNVASILKEGLTYSHAKGIEGPKAIYASETGFYGKPGKVPTIEFHVPKDQWEAGTFVTHDVPPENIIAVHLPWHSQVRYLEDNPASKAQALAGEYDTLTGDYAKAVTYIKQKYGVAKEDQPRSPNGEFAQGAHTYRKVEFGPRSLTSEAASEAFRDTITDPKTLSRAQRQALASYGSVGYSAMNKNLRSADPDRLKYLEQREDIEGMDSAIAGSKLPENLQLFRGVNNWKKAFGVESEEGLLGKTVQDNGFVSTSTSPKSAFNFTTPDKDGVATIIEIHAPKDMHAVAMPTFVGENEVVLPRGSQFKVTAVGHEDLFIDYMNRNFPIRKITIEPVSVAKADVTWYMRKSDSSDSSDSRFVWQPGDLIVAKVQAIAKGDQNHEPAGSPQGGQFASNAGNPLTGDHSTMITQWTKKNKDGTHTVVETHKMPGGKQSLIYHTDAQGNHFKNDQQPISYKDAVTEVNNQPDDYKNTFIAPMPSDSGSHTGDPAANSDEDKPLAVPGDKTTLKMQYKAKGTDGTTDVLETHEINHFSRSIAYIEAKDGSISALRNISWKDLSSEMANTSGYVQTYDKQQAQYHEYHIANAAAPYPNQEPDEAEELAQPSIQALGSKDENAIQMYTSSNYVSMNKYLRNDPDLTDPDSRWTPAQLENAKLRTKALTAALHKLKVPSNVTVYRGLGMTGEAKLGELKVGSTFIDPGFASTSISPTFAAEWSTAKKVFRLQVDKGTPGGYVAAISNAPSEGEYLFPPNAKFTVTGVSKGPLGKSYEEMSDPVTIYDAKLSY